MAATACDLDGDAVCRGHHGARVDANRARLHGGPVVHGVDGLHRKAVKQSVFHHHPRTGKAFLARLEYQHGRAVEVTRLREVTRSSHQHGRVSVVAATVHQSGLARLPGKVVVLRQRQCIHVSPQAHHGAAGHAAPTNHRHDACAADALVDLIHTADLERLYHPLAGVNLFKTQFRVRVQVAAQCSQLRMKLGDVGKRPPARFQARALHQCPPALPTRRRGSTTKYSKSTTRLMTTKIKAIRHR